MEYKTGPLFFLEFVSYNKNLFIVFFLGAVPTFSNEFMNIHFGGIQNWATFFFSNLYRITRIYLFIFFLGAVPTFSNEFMNIHFGGIQNWATFFSRICIV